MIDIIEYLKGLAERTGETLLNSADEKHLLEFKTSSKDVVTDVDKRIQDELIDTIKNQFSSAAFFAEENIFYSDLMADELFVIDPIDGTSNFIKKADYSAVSIAFYQKGNPVAGVVYNPFSNEMFTAKTGEGAFLNGRPLRIPEATLSGSLVAFGTSPYNEETTDETFELIKSVYGRCLDIRRLGSAALDICHVADGRYGLYFEAALSFWDYAAAAIVLREAGGVLLNFHGQEISVNGKKTSVIAGTKAVIDESHIIR